jgi:PAS domain S-box-containing protein
MSHSPEPALRDCMDEQYRLLTENVKDFAIFMLDTQGSIATWNSGAERILGYKDAEIVGQPYAIIFSPQEIVNRQPEHELSIARDKGRSEDERWHVRKDGSQLWASGVVTPLWDGSGKLRGYAKVMRDITDRKKAEVELAEANQRKDEFLAMLAHELRNPLAPILNAIHLLRREKQVSTSQNEATNIIDRQVRQIIRLVDDLLDISRISRGKIHLRKERVELSNIVQQAVETAKPLIDARRHEVTVSLPAETIWLEADPARLEQVIGNLLTNAAKYTEPGGRIWVTGTREGLQVILRIKDTGIGILPEMLPRVFDLFVQADRSLERAEGGLGIGLTLVKSLVHLHQGTIEAHSPGVGQGSEFVIRLHTVPEVAGTSPDAVTAVTKKIRPLRLLVVDDNTDTVESLAMLLRLSGHNVQTANTGPSGLQAAVNENLDVAMLDIGLPGIDGYEVARRIRLQTDKPVLIAMTGYGQPEDRQRTQDAGFDYHLVKPVDPEKLQNLLSKIAKFQ